MSDDDLLARTTEAVSRLQAENAALREQLKGAQYIEGCALADAKQAEDAFEGAHATVEALGKKLSWADQRIEQLEAGLREIKEWKPPMVKSRIDGRKVSFGVEYGSNGERDYFRHVAEKALLAAPQPEGE
jgi:hypothetical protein